jgi:hypothetical protein
MSEDIRMERLLELLEELNELFPGMDKMIINDSSDPDYIILATTEYLNTMADAFGISDEFEEVADFPEEYPDLPKKKKLQ